MHPNILLIWAATVGSGAGDAAVIAPPRPSPPLPATSVPTASPLPLPISPSPRESDPGRGAGSDGDARTAVKRKGGPPPKITLGKTSDTLTPFRHGASIAS